MIAPRWPPTDATPLTPALDQTILAIEREAQQRFPMAKVTCNRSPALDALEIAIQPRMKPRVNVAISNLAIQGAPNPTEAAMYAIEKGVRQMAAGIPIYTSPHVGQNDIYLCNTNATTTSTWDTGTTASATSMLGNNWYTLPDDGYNGTLQPNKVLTPGKHVREIKLKDGTVIKIDEQGNFVIVDKDAKVTYQAHRNRDFNPYVNAGDLMGRFIDYVRQSVPGVKRSDIPEIPIQVFVNWLILEAASQDGDAVPADVEPVPKSRLLVARVKPQCRLPNCRRFIPRVAASAGFNYCNGEHADSHIKLLKAA
jgi:hypothetical protein